METKQCQEITSVVNSIKEFYKKNDKYNDIEQYILLKYIKDCYDFIELLKKNVVSSELIKVKFNIYTSKYFESVQICFPLHFIKDYFCIIYDHQDNEISSEYQNFMKIYDKNRENYEKLKPLMLLSLDLLSTHLQTRKFINRYFGIIIFVLFTVLTFFSRIWLKEFVDFFASIATMGISIIFFYYFVESKINLYNSDVSLIYKRLKGGEKYSRIKNLIYFYHIIYLMTSYFIVLLYRLSFPNIELGIILLVIISLGVCDIIYKFWKNKIINKSKNEYLNPEFQHRKIRSILYYWFSINFVILVFGLFLFNNLDLSWISGLIIPLAFIILNPILQNEDLDHFPKVKDYSHEFNEFIDKNQKIIEIISEKLIPVTLFYSKQRNQRYIFTKNKDLFILLGIIISSTISSGKSPILLAIISIAICYTSYIQFKDFLKENLIRRPKRWLFLYMTFMVTIFIIMNIYLISTWNLIFT